MYCSPSDPTRSDAFAKLGSSRVSAKYAWSLLLYRMMHVVDKVLELEKMNGPLLHPKVWLAKIYCCSDSGRSIAVYCTVKYLHLHLYLYLYRINTSFARARVFVAIRNSLPSFSVEQFDRKFVSHTRPEWQNKRTLLWQI
jgi:uncharacterized Zn-finger protein